MLDTKFWEKYFKTYDVLNMVIPYKELMSDLIESLDIRNGDKILDAGAGTGNLSVQLKQRGAEVIALDSSEEGLRILSNKDKSIKTFVHDLTKPLPFMENSFDKVVSNNVIYTIPPSSRIVLTKDFYRILKPGGKIVISDVKVGWKPIEIYKYHIISDIKDIGALKLIVKMIKMFLPTVKMFYYNSKIKKEHKGGDYSFLSEGEHGKLFSEAGFIDISKDKLVYGSQAFLTSAYK